MVRLYLFTYYALQWYLAFRNLNIYLGIAISGFTDFVEFYGGIMEGLPPVARCPREEAPNVKIWNTEPFLKISSI